MEELELLGAFCEPVVSDDVLRNPLITAEFYKDLLVERNSNDLCAWCKCPNPIRCNDLSECPIFCTTNCQFYSQQFLASLIPPSQKKAAIGPIVEKFAEQRPPKPLKAFKADDIEGHRVRVGPYRDNLNEIEKWFGEFTVAPLKGLTQDQETVFELVNKTLRPFSVTLNRTADNLFLFGNMEIGNVKALTEADEKIKQAFSIALFEMITGTDISPLLKHNNISSVLYDDMFGIVSQGADDDL
ncbi:hypothetical protein TRFO_22573 [Tritrichomonas foetus]|uniref:RTR1-type domain-containing protein n=1 Tax=Tritrichomonas foetus TaxID=1144522 RepID=A0A1J4KBN0_9EUKA|nr:hypothetical protein TRFO_22573 [Tritrichomonas foetus]|eukprot:OHT08815.1 hypothetical protein TRFO_22573 [Tritrichomonas foetus]